MNNANSNDTDDEARPDELTLLRERADLMGIQYNSRIGTDKLREKISKALAGAPVRADEEDEDDEDEVVVVRSKKPKPLTKDEEIALIREALQKEQLRLIRLRITNLNPNKKDLHGEIFTVANRYLGIVKKFIPYGEVTENGYHVPFIFYTQMKDRKFLNIRVRTDKQTGQERIEQNWVPEFALEILDPLTLDELATLAATQAAAGGVN